MKTFARLGQTVSFTVLSFIVLPATARAAEVNPPPPALTIQRGSNGAPQFTFPLYPAAQQYQILSAPDVNSPFTPDITSGRLLAPLFQVTNGGPRRFYRLGVTPMSSNDVLIANVLNRLTYGATPDSLDYIRSIGPQAFIAEQMAAELITDTINVDPPITNAPIVLPQPPPLTNWIRKSANGTASNTNLFLYLSASGRVYVDDVRLVLGTNADTGPNLIVNGDFEEAGLTNFGWAVSSIYAGSRITNSPTVDGIAASGTNCLLIVGTSGGSGAGASLMFPYSLTNYPSGTRFTLSFSYLPVQNTGTNILTVRLSGSTTITNVALPSSGPTPPTPPTPPPAISATYGRLDNTNASLDDFRAWHIYRAIHGPRQLHEVLAQFFQNHLTTQYQKTSEWFDNNYSNAITNSTTRQQLSVELHWREHQKIRAALLNPNCNFYDLLKVSIESPAMVIYLDTVLNTRAAPNQNYGREILELHTMGADNGYIQQDIVDLAKVWTGWQVRKKDPAVADNPFAPSVVDTTNAPGYFVLHYNTNNHDLGTKRLFTNNVIDPRFGSFGGGLPYSLILTSTLATITNGFREGYTVAQHLANLPYTMEYLSVKLCQVFVHENFDYGIYDYTAANPTPEVQLVKDCMTAWNTPAADGRKGNIRSILTVIFNSDLFRSQGSSQQKVKTPLEYAVSAVRALRIASTDTNGWTTTTADSDGLGIISPLSRMGGMGLFNKPEPDGWSELGGIWLNTANLCERMRYVQSLMMSTGNSLKSSDYGSTGLRNTSDPVKLLKLKLPAASWNDPAAVVDYFLGLLYPGEGAGNLSRDRDAAITYLNTAENGTASLFSAQGHTTTGYDGRVRSMVGFLLSLPRFQEQ